MTEIYPVTGGTRTEAAKVDGQWITRIRIEIRVHDVAEARATATTLADHLTTALHGPIERARAYIAGRCRPQKGT